MLVIRILKSRQLLPCLLFCILTHYAFGSSTTYQQAITVTPDGKPSLQLTNTSESPITAFVMVESPSSGLEGRRYYDAFTNGPDRTIMPGASVTLPLGYFQGSDVTKVRAKIRAVIFEDGSSAGEQAWINEVLIRRIRLYDRLLSLHDLLRGELDSGRSRQAVIEKLRASKAEADAKLPNDDLRVIDDVCFESAISTIEAKSNGEVNIELAIQRYLKHIQYRASQLERSRPTLDTIRALPTTLPAPLAEINETDQLLTGTSKSTSPAGIEPAAGTLSYCTVSLAQTTVTDTTSCVDSDGDTVPLTCSPVSAQS